MLPSMYHSRWDFRRIFSSANFPTNRKTVYVDLIIYYESCAFRNVSIFVGFNFTVYVAIYARVINLKLFFHPRSTTDSLYYRFPGFSWFSPNVNTAAPPTRNRQFIGKFLRCFSMINIHEYEYTGRYKLTIIIR